MATPNLSPAAFPSLSQVATGTPAERFVLERVRRGREADLTGLQDKQLDAGFLNTLLFRTAAKAIPAKAISIKGATIVGALAVPRGSPAIPNMIAFNRCVFNDQVNLSDARFDQSLIIQNSTFRSDVHLDSDYVKGDILIEASSIQDDAFLTMELTHVEGTVRLLDLGVRHLNSPGLVARRFDLIIPSGFSVDDVNLVQSETDLLEISAAQTGETDIQKLDLSKAKVKNQLWIHNMDIATLTGDTVQSTGITLFAPSLSIGDRLDLSDAQLGFFTWKSPEVTRWPKEIEISGLVFQDLEIATEGEKEGSENLPFLETANSSETAYTTFETNLRKLGRISEADFVYKAMRAKRRQEAWDSSLRNHAGQFGAAVFVTLDWLQNVFLGYGRFPLPPILWSVCFVVLGTALFVGSEMEPAKSDEEDRPRYSRFWYSLELFLPVVDLGVAKSWRPKAEDRRLLAYARVHQLAGWVLIPVTLAAITGAIK